MTGKTKAGQTKRKQFGSTLEKLSSATTLHFKKFQQKIKLTPVGIELTSLNITGLGI